jgi:hypothetical protein
MAVDADVESEVTLLSVVLTTVDTDAMPVEAEVDSDVTLLLPVLMAVEAEVDSEVTLLLTVLTVVETDAIPVDAEVDRVLVVVSGVHTASDAHWADASSGAAAIPRATRAAPAPPNVRDPSPGRLRPIPRTRCAIRSIANMRLRTDRPTPPRTRLAMNPWLGRGRPIASAHGAAVSPAPRAAFDEGAKSVVTRLGMSSC